MLVPDTNAVLWQPDLTKWTAGDATIVLVPAVISELDSIKARSGDLAAKAQKAIRVIESVASRGDTFSGVTLVGKTKLREVATHPDLEGKPGWLRAGHADDTLIASTLDIVVEDLRAEVTLVTRDRNLHNKARLAGLQSAPAEQYTPQA